MKVTFTGHRPDKINNEQDVFDKLEKSLIKELGADLSLHEFYVGGAPGFDTIALRVLLSHNVPKDRIILSVPFKGFEKYAGKSHPKENQASFDLNYSSGVIVKEVGGKEGSFGQKCFKRNMFMVDNSEILFTNWDGTSGGTANTVKLAQRKNIKIVNVMD